MLKFYGYIGLLLVIFAEINFYTRIEPFATWYIPIVWFGYILFVDSLVFRIRKKSLISNYQKEFAFMALVSMFFWSIFEFYNIFTQSWTYSNYVWYVHIVDFTTIMPAVLETFMLISALGLFRSLDKKAQPIKSNKNKERYTTIVKLLVIFGAFIAILPLITPNIGINFVWFGLFLFLDPLNYLTGRPSVLQMASKGRKSIIARLFLAGITMGFFWEFWNSQAYPKWIYNLPALLPSFHLFAMPVFGYIGYLPFALETYLFYTFARSFVFDKGNELLEIT
ncbi:MAG: hypothetical protein ACHQX1_01965 [Candidatus Micrarchaeales archaeon]